MTDDFAIRVQGLGKKYTISHDHRPAPYRSLRDAVMGAARSMFNKPEAEIKEEFWALRDVSFDIARGEAIGVIGRNGAGKSTFLKILSRITEPSAGEVRVAGRVSSLLEVGTGFHPELTGRENIYLNGTILGLTRREIDARFDDIVAFSGVEQFLDTPVKRYSSGMYTRLAFAVAAHLDSEILVVDEVLAVGDAEFQRKCLGRMHDIAGEGRTVLFVSHNMAAIKSLTSRCIVLDRGRIVFDGATDMAIAAYQSAASVSRAPDAEFAGAGLHTRIISAQIVNDLGSAVALYDVAQALNIEIVVETDGSPRLSIEAMFNDAQSAPLGMFSLAHFTDLALPKVAGRYRVRVSLGPVLLAAGRYHVDLYTSVVNSNWDHIVRDALTFEVAWCSPGGNTHNFQQSSGHGAYALMPHGDVVIEPVLPVISAVPGADGAPSISDPAVFSIGGGA
ncbi:MAG: ATP-binding cassette domain-containing protein [Sphingomonas sp.]|uniref:ABC transporter ATP-binding protein n=1 Tax=Sphingomonas sp. TaxID=28214 RepID=UPI0035A91226|nr:ATP-binding cassette domain-containing protein [Sphingomonas sp.]